MADPFTERTVTLIVTTPTSTYKLLVMESEAVAAINGWRDRDVTAKYDTWLIEHAEGGIVIQLSNVEAMNAIIAREAKREVVESLR